MLVQERLCGFISASWVRPVHGARAAVAAAGWKVVQRADNLKHWQRARARRRGTATQGSCRSKRLSQFSQEAEIRSRVQTAGGWRCLLQVHSLPWPAGPLARAGRRWTAAQGSCRSKLFSQLSKEEAGCRPRAVGAACFKFIRYQPGQRAWAGRCWIVAQGSYRSMRLNQSRQWVEVRSSAQAAGGRHHQNCLGFSSPWARPSESAVERF